MSKRGQQWLVVTLAAIALVVIIFSAWGPQADRQSTVALSITAAALRHYRRSGQVPPNVDAIDAALGTENAIGFSFREMCKREGATVSFVSDGSTLNVTVRFDSPPRTIVRSAKLDRNLE